MSFMHSMVFHFCKKGKRRYSPDEPQDYPAKRAAEVRQNRFVRIPKQVQITETVLGGVPAELLTHPKNPTDRIVLYLHGGGFVVGSVKTRRMFTGYLADRLGYNVAAPEYRLAPEHPYPAAPEDAMKAWNYLMLLGYGARDVILTGDSAGGNLALSLMLRLKQEGRLLPRGLVLMSPWTDLTSSGESFLEKAELDPVLTNAYIDSMIKAYAPGEELTDPRISPLFGDFTGFPPVYIQVGENEILLSDSARLHQAFVEANVPVRMDIFPGMWHVFQMSPMKAARTAMDKNAEFIYDICR